MMEKVCSVIRVIAWIHVSVCKLPVPGTNMRCTRCGTWYAELATKQMQHAANKPSFDNMVSKQIYLRIYLLLIQYSRRVYKYQYECRNCSKIIFSNQSTWTTSTSSTRALRWSSWLMLSANYSTIQMLKYRFMGLRISTRYSRAYSNLLRATFRCFTNR